MPNPIEPPSRTATRRLAALALIALALSGCTLGTDPSPNPLKPCPAGMTRHIEKFTPVYEYACFRDSK